MRQAIIYVVSRQPVPGRGEDGNAKAGRVLHDRVHGGDGLRRPSRLRAAPLIEMTEGAWVASCVAAEMASANPASVLATK